MDDKFLSGEEKRAKLKEAYKKDLQERKSFLEKVNAQKHLNQISSTLEDMTKRLIGDDTDEWIQKLNQESALADAKMDMVLGNHQSPEELESPALQVSDTTSEKTLGELSSTEKIPDPADPPTNKTLF